MKILAFTDIHGSLSALKRIRQKVKFQNPDLLVCAGDISLFERGLVNILRKLNKFNKKTIIIHGNHEDDSLFAKYSKSFKNIIFVHKKHFLEQNVLFLGYGGGGFALVDREFERFSARFKDLIKNNLDKKIVFLTHAPPYKTKLDKIMQGHCGNKSFRNFVEKTKVDLMICGHLHENFGKGDKINKTKIINPGPFGKIIEV
ncbi:metallophosphoesterase [Candidatus Woesearchaeota archaeon]|nr:metallophosphoesterase [Candidatus Woesearchaeota archaeon]